jgi:hypothetical protein
MERDPIKFKKFKQTWRELEKTGKCDGWGGAECRRVYRTWLKFGQPLVHLKKFIYREANRF